MSVKINTKHASYSLVTFVTHKRFAVFFFLSSCCVNSLIIVSLGNTTGRQKEENGNMPVCDKRDRAITCVFCCDPYLKCFLVFYKNICLREDEVRGNFFFPNKIIVTQGLPSSFALPSCSVSSLIIWCRFDWQMEVMASRHKDDNSVACIVDKCYVLSYPEYCR